MLSWSEHLAARANLEILHHVQDDLVVKLKNLGIIMQGDALPQVSLIKGRFRGIVYITGGKQPTLQGGREFGCAYMHKKKPNPYWIRLEEAATYSPT